MKKLILSTAAVLSFSSLAQGLNFDLPVLEVKKEESAKPTGPWSQITPSLDLRMVYLNKEASSNAGRQGLGLMQTVLGLDFASTEDMQIVTRYDLGFMRTGAREVYVAYTAIPEINEFRIGRFNLPFGHRLSDHRVYVKKFFAVSINDFETGVSAQKALGNFSLTLSLMQGLGSGEAFQNNEQLVTPAIDLRGDFEVGASELSLGTSAFQTYRASGKNGNHQTDRSFAATLFGKFKYSNLGLWGEATWGAKRTYLLQDFNAFIGDASFANSLKDKKALGFWNRIDYSIKKKITPFYEYDQIVFDTSHHADRFQKHSVGSKFQLNESSDLEARVEFPLEGRKENPDLRRPNTTFLTTLHAFF